MENTVSLSGPGNDRLIQGSMDNTYMIGFWRREKESAKKMSE
jgi:hypothetical protein